MKRGQSLLILLAGTLWGTMGIYVRRYNEEGLQALDIVAIRVVLTFIILLIGLICIKPKLLSIRLKDTWCFLGTGLCSILFFNYCYFKTISMTSMSVAAILLYTAPSIVMLFSYFLFKEQITRIKIVALILAFVGCIFVTGIIGNESDLSGAGILTGLGAGLGYALYSIFSRYALERGYHSLTILLYTFLFASMGVLLMVDRQAIGRVVLKDGESFVFALALATATTILPYLTYTIGLKYVETGKASILASIEPVVATVLGILLYGEVISLSGIMGIFMVILSIIICNLQGKSQFQNNNKSYYQDKMW